jgi:hypothetical protein
VAARALLAAAPCLRLPACLPPTHPPHQPPTSLQAKTKELKSSFNEQFGAVHELCLMVLNASQKPDLIRATLATLHAFLSWVPLGYIFESNVIEVRRLGGVGWVGGWVGRWWGRLGGWLGLCCSWLQLLPTAGSALQASAVLAALLADNSSRSCCRAVPAAGAAAAVPAAGV